MWRKIEKFNDIPAILLIAIVASREEESPFNMISWKTQDGLLHLCSFKNFKEITNEDIDPKTKFTIWEQISKKE